MTIRLTWLGHASVKITSASTTIYIDPWKIDIPAQPADIILLTHDHYDHYSQADLKAVSDASSHIVAPMSALLVTDHITPGNSLNIKDVSILAVPAYNMGKAFHPKTNGWVGYIVTISGNKIYHTGDTDRIPEMKGLVVDAVFMPVGGTYTMDAKEASDAIKDIKTVYAIPIHYGDIVGSRKDAKEFAGLCSCDVRILNPGEYLDIEEKT
jgi:L-ascorbate metabolism protein UlaG (beta-lactamase superfamily)